MTISSVLIAAAVDNTLLTMAGITTVAFAAALFVAFRGKPARSGRAMTPRLVADGARDEDAEPQVVRWFELAFLATMAGYILFDRAFAWLHVPGTPLFVGEMVLGLGVAMLLTTPNRISPIIRLGGSLKALRLFMLWGAGLLALGITAWGLDAIRDSALWYYGIFAFLVATAIVWDPKRLDRWTQMFGRLIPFMLLWYPVAILLKTSPALSNVDVPDSNVSILSHRSGNMAVLAALAVAYLWLVDSDGTVYTRRQRSFLTTLATVVILFTGLQNRGGLVAATAVIAVLLFMLSRRRLDLAFVMVGVAIVLGSVAFAFDIRLEVFDQRDVSVEQFVDNVTSIFDREAGSSREQDTTEWRLRIWQSVLDDVSAETPIMGFGMGPDLGERYDITSNPEAPLRNPHNSHVGILARMGWVGITLWVILWVTWFVEMQTTRRRLRSRRHLREARIAGWLMISPIPVLVNAVFDPTLEGAQVAMWLWAVFGAGATLVVLARMERLHLTEQDTSAEREQRLAKTR